MTTADRLARSVHHLSAAAWFGGTLMGAVGVDGAAGAARDPRERTRLSAIGWKRWRPVETAALVAHGLSGAWLLRADRARAAAGDGLGRSAVAEAAVTVAGAAAAAYSGYLGRQVEARAEEGGEGATEPRPGASPALAAAQRRLKVLQWVNPALAGAVIVLAAEHGERQRPRRVPGGLLRQPPRRSGRAAQT